MARLLYVMCDVKSPAGSSSFKIASDFIVEYFKCNPRDELDVIDLPADRISIDEDVMSGREKIKNGDPPMALNEYEHRKLSRIKRLTGNFIAADKYVFVTPDWNAALPVQFNEYIASLCAFGKVFKMLPVSPIDLIRQRNKKCMHIYSTTGSGNGQEERPPLAYFRFMMKSLGISEVESIAIEDIGSPPDTAKAAMAEAEREAIEKAKTF